MTWSTFFVREDSLSVNTLLFKSPAKKPTGLGFLVGTTGWDVQVLCPLGKRSSKGPFACGYLAVHFPARGSDRITDVILKPAERSSPPGLILRGSEPGFPLKRKIPHVYNLRGKGPVRDESQSLIVLKMLWACSVTQSCLTLFDPMDHSPPGSSIHLILQTRSLDWVAMPLSNGIFPTQGLNLQFLHWQQILYHWAFWEAWRCYKNVDILDRSMQMASFEQFYLWKHLQTKHENERRHFKYNI